MSLLSLFTRPSTVAKVSPAANANRPGAVKGRLVAGSAVLLLATVTVGGFEGMTTKAVIPIPGDVPTICFGETRGVRMGDTATPDKCRAMLGVALTEFEAGMRRCLVAPDAIPDRPYVAFLSLSYNVGTGAFCKSTVARKANANDLRGACDAILAWDKAGGKRIPGLTRRRQEERTLCLEGVR